MLAYVECMAKREFNACTATASLSGWASPGETITTGLCGTYTVITTNGVETRNFSPVGVDATYPAGDGTCMPGEYRTRPPGRFVLRSRPLLSTQRSGKVVESYNV